MSHTCSAWVGHEHTHTLRNTLLCSLVQEEFSPEELPTPRVGSFLSFGEASFGSSVLQQLHVSSRWGELKDKKCPKTASVKRWLIKVNVLHYFCNHVPPTLLSYIFSVCVTKQ